MVCRIGTEAESNTTNQQKADAVCCRRKPLVSTLHSVAALTQRAQHPLIKEHTLTYKGLSIII